MKVILLDHTENPVKKIGYCARICYSNLPASEIKNNLSDFEAVALTKKIINAGHHSILETVNFTFGIEEISRITSHQLVRYRMASYSQQSQRYTKFNGSLVYPEYLNNIPEVKEIIEKVEKESIDNYEKLLSLGIPKEDARYFIPAGSSTNIIVTMNARSLYNFLNQRLCSHAQNEIRKLANEMFNILEKKWPIIFNLNNCGPNCIVNKNCREQKPCGGFKRL